MAAVVGLAHEEFRGGVVFAAAAGGEEGGVGWLGDAAGETEICQSDDGAVESLPVWDVGVGGDGDVEEDVLELDVAVDDVFLVEVADGGHELGEDAAHKRWDEDGEVGAGDFEEVAAGTVVHYEEGARAVSVAKGFEVDYGGVLGHFHNLDFALEGDFDAFGIGTTRGAMVDDFDGDEALGAELYSFHCYALLSKINVIIFTRDLSDS